MQTCYSEIPQCKTKADYGVLSVTNNHCLNVMVD